ncbi:MAG: T9SS type A sorting domain-containing protein, partial [Flavobacterium sp.]|nr:T9SS type A sorting domain-containing protein [Flavobacterium sp.]
ASIEQFDGTYNHYLYTRLSNLMDGNLVSIDSNGLVVTSNILLNAIFQQFNVNFFELAFPSSTSCCLNLFTVGCQFCDTAGLKSALQGLEGGVLANSSTSNIPYAFLSIDGKDFEKMSVLFPNPTTGIFEIQINGQFQDLDLEIFDKNGRVVYNSKMNILQDSSQTIDISSLSNGIYFLRIKNEQFSQTEKIVKK